MPISCNNIILIGMPGVGKSTAGVILAKRLGMNFIDTDIYIQQRAGGTLHGLIAAQGLKAFCDLEAAYVTELDVQNHIIATGGSVVYGAGAMARLKSAGTVIWLDLPYAQLAQRLGDLDARGVVMEPGQTLEHLYHYRRPYYAKYADITLDTRDLSIDKAVRRMIELIDGK